SRLLDHPLGPGPERTRGTLTRLREVDDVSHARPIAGNFQQHVDAPTEALTWFDARILSGVRWAGHFVFLPCCWVGGVAPPGPASVFTSRRPRVLRSRAALLFEHAFEDLEGPSVRCLGSTNHALCARRAEIPVAFRGPQMEAQQLQAQRNAT